jgi:hypothetical protein
MLKPIEDKENKIEFSALSLFNSMTDEDFIAVKNAGQLLNLCLALSLDLEKIDSEKSKNTNSYLA